MTEKPPTPRPSTVTTRPCEVLPASPYGGQAPWITEILRTKELWPEPPVVTFEDEEGAA